jgi:hypothetical protein
MLPPTGDPGASTKCHEHNRTLPNVTQDCGKCHNSRQSQQYVCVYVCIMYYVCRYICMYVCVSIHNLCICVLYVCMYVCMYVCLSVQNVCIYRCPRRKGPNFGRVFLRSNYTDITQNTYIQRWMVTDILAREKCGLIYCLRNVLRPWRHTRIRLTFNARIMQ